MFEVWSLEMKSGGKRGGGGGSTVVRFDETDAPIDWFPYQRASL